VAVLTWMFAGALAAAVLVAVWGRRAWEVGAWRVALALAAVVYPAAAMAAGMPAAATREFAGALPWILVAAVGGRFSPVFLATAWAVHGAWDLLPVARPWIPGFYPPACLGFDVAAALRLSWLAYRPRRNAP
jgi:hypothetical protein